jgi:hypothetical protein
VTVEGHDIFIKAQRVIAVKLQQSVPPPPDSQYPVALVNGMVDEGFQGRIQARHIAAAGKNRNGFLSVIHGKLLFP